MMSLKGRKGMERIRVSGCIMTQGAPELLAGCLEDMAFADEIIVVDGGPDEGTRKVTQSHPKAQYIAHPWPGNYSSQRNVYIERARGDWIFTMDTDERLGAGFAEGIEGWAARDNTDGYCFPRLWRVTESEIVVSEYHYPDFNCRLFRKRPAVRYQDGLENAVHHAFVGIEKPLLLLQTPVILHDCLRYEDRRSREEKIRHYDVISSNQSGSRYKAFYLYEDHPHRICSLSERPAIASLPWMASLTPYLQQ
jgi:glycosyltransferase involved in cell wall biosynthesis